ncbi:OmpL47-type beta-barrel domain-containing protein [Streptomyces griseoloalbus]|uniref:Plastocyanin n=1 Tax=Streptomyces griseoloalbus TaxID=67303 RepID=A0A7W8BPP8_9ACTN|nr:family 16 glycoside hydrolase [Streptomyces albaduncus]MBB5126518.1 plastocyanin [Streptomyces albaduncus]GGW76141.1 glycosyl hydrolase [Streptomyces albaduncus]
MWAALLAALLMMLGLQTATSTAGETASTDTTAAAQVLTWTAGDGITEYTSAPTTAVAGPATIVFENSAATGNTTGMPHTLTFATSDPEFNNDVQLNILANPSDAQGGKHTAEVTLTPGRYFYHCTIPGHGEMQGILTVTEGSGEDTTAPEATAKVTGTQNAKGEYVGSASVVVEATDAGSGVDRIEYAIGADGAWQPYTAPVVVDQVGAHTVRYRALDKAGNVSADKSVEFTVVAQPSDDTTAPDTSATVDGEKNPDGAYIDMATVTVTASDTGSGVNTIEYAIGADGAWQAYTGPVMVHQTGTHTVRYRATDKAGNAAAEKSVEFTVVAAPPQDTTPPATGVTVEGTRNSDGAYVGDATVTISADDGHGGSGVAGIEYSLDGGPYLAYTEPVVVDRAGRHTLAYRASDKAGNTSAPLTTSFTVVADGGVPAPNCPEYDERLTVIVGTVDSGVPNRVTNNRCRIGELIEDEKEWTSQALFLKHVQSVLDALQKEGVMDKREYRAINKAARQSGIGKPGQTEGYRKILDGTEESFARWEQVGGGSFALNPDGSITSGTTKPGLGMLWFPERKYGDFSLKLQWRDDAPGTGNANSGVFVRFPQVHDHPEESRPEWVAIKYGHEVQAFDSPSGDMYKSGSIYGFDRVGLAGAGVTQKGTWNDYEIRVVDQHYSVYRNGVLINEFDNTGGQDFTPPRSDDPGTDGRRFASGYIGLQVHGTTDVVSYRDVRIREL